MARRRPPRGISMIEVLIALAVVAAALLPMVGLTRTQAGGARLGELHLAACARARGVADSLAGLGYDALSGLALAGDVAAPCAAEPWCTERVSFVQLEAGLGLLVVEVAFTPPGQAARAGERVARVERFVARLDQSLRGRHPLPAKGGGRGVS